MNNKGSEAKKANELKTTCFLLLEPKSLCDSGEIARRLARFKGVGKVHLTSGRYGLILSTSASPGRIGRIVSTARKASKSVEVVLSHQEYSGT